MRPLHRLLTTTVAAVSLGALGLSPAVADAGNPEVMRAGMQISTGEYMLSPNGQHSLWVGPDVQPTGLAVEGRCDPKYLVERLPDPIRDAVLVMQGDGNLVLYQRGAPVWHTRTHGNPGAHTRLQDDGNVVVYSAGNRPLWQSATTCHAISNVDGQVGDHATRYLDEGQYMMSRNRQYRMVMQTDGNAVLYRGTQPLWQSNTRGRGNTLRVEINNDVTVRSSSGSRLWRSDTAVSDIRTAPAVTLTLQDDGNLVLYRYEADGRFPAVWHTRTHGR